MKNDEVLDTEPMDGLTIIPKYREFKLDAVVVRPITSADLNSPLGNFLGTFVEYGDGFVITQVYGSVPAITRGVFRK